MVEFIRNVRNWEHEFHSTTGMVGVDMNIRGFNGVIRARNNVGVRTGALYNSIHYTIHASENGPYVEIGSSNRIALLHHEGSPAHVISVRDPRRYLRFVQNGQVRYAKSVKHPGTRPNRYLVDILPYLVR